MIGLRLLVAVAIFDAGPICALASYHDGGPSSLGWVSIGAAMVASLVWMVGELLGLAETVFGKGDRA